MPDFCADQLALGFTVGLYGGPAADGHHRGALHSRTGSRRLLERVERIPVICYADC